MKNFPRLRFNHPANCWEVLGFLAGSKYQRWRWMRVTTEVARNFANAGVRIDIEETVA